MTLSKKSAQGTLQRLFEYSPYWALATFIRIGDAKATDEIFNRQALLKFRVDGVDNLIDGYLGALERAEPDISQGDELQANNFGDLLAKVVPEVLSRLCCKCTEDKKIPLLDFLRKVYGSENKNYYRGILHLLERLLATYSELGQYRLIPKLLEIPYPESTTLIAKDEYTNPFQSINIDKDGFLTEKLHLEPDRIEVLFGLAAHGDEAKRKWAMASLVRLCLWGLLTDINHYGLKVHSLGCD